MAIILLLLLSMLKTCFLFHSQITWKNRISIIAKHLQSTETKASISLDKVQNNIPIHHSNQFESLGLVSELVDGLTAQGYYILSISIFKY